VIVLETSALVTIVTGQPRAEEFAGKLAATEALLPAHCLLEAHMVITGRFPPAMLVTLDRVVAAGGITVHPFTAAHAAAAREGFLRFGKGRHRAGLNFGDCMSYGVAKAEGLPLLFTGGDFAMTDVGVA
jgi:ribonuclease VapC